jgi:hypothetical protein
VLLYQAQQSGDPLFGSDIDVFAGGLVLALSDLTPAGAFAEAGTGISTGRWEAPGVRIGGTARAVRGAAGVAETALFGLGSSTALQSSTAAALEVKVFTSTGGRLRLGLFSQGELLGLLEPEAAATRIPFVPPAGEQLMFRFPEATPAAAGVSDFQALRGTVGFLRSEGLPAQLRREMIEAGFRGAISEIETPRTFIRFQKLFPETIQAGEAFEGRLGNIPTRVATIMEAQALERSGLIPGFEHWTGRHAIDLVGLDAAREPVAPAIQFVKWNRLWPEEIPKSFLITRDTGLPVRFVVTGP